MRFAKATALAVALTRTATLDAFGLSNPLDRWKKHTSSQLSYLDSLRPSDKQNIESNDNRFLPETDKFQNSNGYRDPVPPLSNGAPGPSPTVAYPISNGIEASVSETNSDELLNGASVADRSPTESDDDFVARWFEESPGISAFPLVDEPSEWENVFESAVDELFDSALEKLSLDASIENTEPAKVTQQESSKHEPQQSKLASPASYLESLAGGGTQKSPSSHSASMGATSNLESIAGTPPSSSYSMVSPPPSAPQNQVGGSSYLQSLASDVQPISSAMMEEAKSEVIDITRAAEINAEAREAESDLEQVVSVVFKSAAGHLGSVVPEDASSLDSATDSDQSTGFDTDAFDAGISTIEPSRPATGYLESLQAAHNNLLSDVDVGSASPESPEQPRPSTLVSGYLDNLEAKTAPMQEADLGDRSVSGAAAQAQLTEEAPQPQPLDVDQMLTPESVSGTEIASPDLELANIASESDCAPPLETETLPDRSSEESVLRPVGTSTGYLESLKPKIESPGTSWGWWQPSVPAMNEEPESTKPRSCETTPATSMELEGNMAGDDKSQERTSPSSDYLSSLSSPVLESEEGTVATGERSINSSEPIQPVAQARTKQSCVPTKSWESDNAGDSIGQGLGGYLDALATSTTGPKARSHSFDLTQTQTDARADSRMQDGTVETVGRVGSPNYLESLAWSVSSTREPIETEDPRHALDPESLLSSKLHDTRTSRQPMRSHEVAAKDGFRKTRTATVDGVGSANYLESLAWSMSSPPDPTGAEDSRHALDLESLLASKLHDTSSGSRQSTSQADSSPSVADKRGAEMAVTTAADRDGSSNYLESLAWSASSAPAPVSTEDSRHASKLHDASASRESTIPSDDMQPRGAEKAGTEVGSANYLESLAWSAPSAPEPAGTEDARHALDLESFLASKLHDTRASSRPTISHASPSVADKGAARKQVSTPPVAAPTPASSTDDADHLESGKEAPEPAAEKSSATSYLDSLSSSSREYVGTPNLASSTRSNDTEDERFTLDLGSSSTSKPTATGVDQPISGRDEMTPHATQTLPLSGPAESPTDLAPTRQVSRKRDELQVATATEVEAPAGSYLDAMKASQPSFTPSSVSQDPPSQKEPKNAYTEPMQDQSMSRIRSIYLDSLRSASQATNTGAPSSNESRATNNSQGLSASSPSEADQPDAPRRGRSQSLAFIRKSGAFLARRPSRIDVPEEVAALRAQPKSIEQEAKLASRYGAIEDLGERAFQVLLDLKMVEESPDPSSSSYDGSQDDEFVEGISYIV